MEGKIAFFLMNPVPTTNTTTVDGTSISNQQIVPAEHERYDKISRN
jgi:hypothetical protein